ncbi:hypothetical protein [Candidatus Palauibacter sp.]|uniref:hypothetical protein n=1 Tax=Candidatus Palauibacter sp. TaxID=3101350 RepID=UPI003B5917CD
MTGFVLFGGILLVLLSTIVWAAIRAGEDTGAALGPADRRDAAIEALRDLELDYHTGKLPDEEYRALRARLEREAVEARDAAVSGGAGTTVPCGACGVALTGHEAFCPACGVAITASG